MVIFGTFFTFFGQELLYLKTLLSLGRCSKVQTAQE